jgi:hypothetical protein
MRIATSLCFLGGALLALAAGCQKQTVTADAGPAIPTPAVPPPPPPPPAPPPTPADGGAALSDPVKVGEWASRTLPPLLQKEAAARPTGTVKAEDVLSAVEKAGVKIQGRNQALASVLGASYCMGADTGSMLGLMICEYPDEAAAQRGRTSTQALFGQAMPVEIHVNKKTTLAITNLVKSERSTVEARKIAEVFQKL